MHDVPQQHKDGAKLKIDSCSQNVPGDADPRASVARDALVQEPRCNGVCQNFIPSLVTPDLGSEDI